MMTHTRVPADHLPLKHEVLMILLVLAEGPRHGYAILGEVERRSGGETVVQTGALYRHLKRLLGDQLITETSPPRSAATDERRRFYVTTALGRAVLRAELERMARVMRAARAVVPNRPRLA